MTNEAEELLNLFILISSNDPNSIQNASAKLTNLSTKSNYSLNLLWIVVNPNIETIHRFSAGIQLKNAIDKNWQRGPFFSDTDKEIIRTQIMSCATSSSFKMGNLYKILADIISKISRIDWDKKWPNLFSDLFQNNAWFIIYRICQVQTTRRLSQGIVLFNNLASAMSREILLKWKDFMGNFDYNTVSNDHIIHNIAYQLKTMGLFIRNTHLIANDDENFCEIVNELSRDVCSCFPLLLKYYHDFLLLSINFPEKISFYKLLKSIIWVLISYQKKNASKFSMVLTNEIDGFFHKVIFNGNFLSKSDKLSLLVFNLMVNHLKSREKLKNLKNPIFDIQIVNYIRLKFLVRDEEEVESLNNDPEVVMDCNKEQEESSIIYSMEDVTENLMVELVKGVTANNFNEIMEMIMTFMNGLDSLNITEVESFIHFIGIIIQSSYYADSANSKKYASFLHCPTIIDRVINNFVNRKGSYISESWKNYLFKRCIWLYSKWVVDDINIGSLSIERLASVSQWCFKVAYSSLGILVKLEVCLYIEHVVDALDKLPANITDNHTMLDIFLNPSIITIVSVLDHTSSSDTHTRLVDILIKLFNGTNMWSNIDLVKTCANSIYNLWIGINRPSRETIILRDRLLECLSTIVKACDPAVIQPILSTLSTFIGDSLNLIVNNGNDKIDNCLVLLDNTLQLWHDIVCNSEILFGELDNIYTLIISSSGLRVELDKNQTTLVLEIIQAYFLLKVLGNVSNDSFSSLTLSSWTHIINQSWNPKEEEDLCVMRIQLFDLWLLGFQQSFKEPLSTLFEMNVYSQFLFDRVKELFITTQNEPSTDPYPSITNGVLTVLARLCLFDRLLMKRIIDYLSTNEIENQNFLFGLLDRWLLRIDNQASNSIQQLFVLAGIHWMSLCCECYPSLISNKLGSIINSCIQICTNVPYNDTEQQTTLAKSLSVPAERHLRLAYLVWNPLNDCSRIRDFVTTFMNELNHSLGYNKFQNMFTALDPVVQHQFIQFCTKIN